MMRCLNWVQTNKYLLINDKYLLAFRTLLTPNHAVSLVLNCLSQINFIACP
jgi:hypothetical protein